MKALVTGGTGFVGANLVRVLLARDYQVRCLVRKGANMLALEGLPVELAYGDILDKPSIEAALAGCGGLFHPAGLYSLTRAQARAIYKTNVDGTRNVLDAALRAGVGKVVFTSTTATRGPSLNGRPNDESSEPRPQDLHSPYRHSKYQAEQVALEYCQRGLLVVVVNPSVPIGPWDVRPTPTGMMLVRFLNGPFPAYLDYGLNLVDVQDVALGHVLAMEKGEAGQRYILANRNVTLRETLAMLGRIAGKQPPRWQAPKWLALWAAYAEEYLYARPFHKEPRIPVDGVRETGQRMHFTSAKAVRELGLPQSPVEGAMERAVAWFKQHRYVD